MPIAAAAKLSNALLQVALRSLVAAKRGYPTLLKKDLNTGIEIVLDRAKLDPLDPSECHPSLQAHVCASHPVHAEQLSCA